MTNLDKCKAKKYQISNILCWRLLLKPRAGCRVLSFTQKSFSEGAALQTNEDYYLRRIDNNKTQSSQFLAQILVRPRRSGTMSKLRRSIIFPSVQFLHRPAPAPSTAVPGLNAVFHGCGWRSLLAGGFIYFSSALAS